MNQVKKHYFSSDWHLSHVNVIRFDKRPFKDVEEMDYKIIANHNAIVQPEDNFYFLGDFAFCKPEKAERFLQQMSGRKFFIKGNHDKRDMIDLYKRYGTYLGQLDEITVNGQHIVLCHYRMDVWNCSHYGSWMLFGHSHGSFPDKKDARSIDVGCNVWDYKPLEFEEIKKIMSKKEFKPIDHHTPNRNGQHKPQS